MTNPVSCRRSLPGPQGAMRTVEAGVTTVGDLGADQYMAIAMRDLINAAK